MFYSIWKRVFNACVYIYLSLKTQSFYDMRILLSRYNRLEDLLLHIHIYVDIHNNIFVLVYNTQFHQYAYIIIIQALYRYVSINFTPEVLRERRMCTILYISISFSFNKPNLKRRSWTTHIIHPHTYFIAFKMTLI